MFWDSISHLSFFFKIHFYYIYLFRWGKECVWKWQDNFQDWVLSFHPVSLRNPTRSSGLEASTFTHETISPSLDLISFVYLCKSSLSQHNLLEMLSFLQYKLTTPLSKIRSAGTVKRLDPKSCVLSTLFIKAGFSTWAWSLWIWRLASQLAWKSLLHFLSPGICPYGHRFYLWSSFLQCECSASELFMSLEL